MITKFIKQVCSILSIDVPVISYDTSVFTSPTQLASYCPEDNTLYLKGVVVSPDLYFAVAHELRHAHQHKNNLISDFYFQSNGHDVESYNSQWEEIDAHAFAYLVMSAFFGISPTFDTFSDELRKKIKTRADVIYREL